MVEGFDIGDANKIINQLKDKLSGQFDRTPRPEPQQWSIWSNPGQAQAQPQVRQDAPVAPVLPQLDTTPAVSLRPEQMVGTGQADAATKQSVYQMIDQARKQGNRNVAAGQFMQAVNMSNNSRDASLQAMSKVEYGLANLGWGFSEEGFKWILEAGSNNPSLYDAKSNQSFLQRLAQAGLPKSAVDLLIFNGQQDPTWYAKDAQATKKLDAAMTGPVFVPSTTPGDVAQGPRPGGDPFAPPDVKPQAVNPNLQQPEQAGGWMKEQFLKTMQSAASERTQQGAFGLYRQATDMADRTGDRTLQATARVETGLALIAWGNTESGFKWLLDAGSKNPTVYDARVNQNLQQRLRAGGLNQPALDYFMKQGQSDPNWFQKDAAAVGTLATIQKTGVNPNSRPAEATLPMPNPFPVQPNPTPWKPQPPAPAPTPFTPHIKPNPFGG